MNNLSRFSGINITGVKAIQYVPLEDVLILPDPFNSVISLQVILKPGKVFYSADLTLYTAGCKEETVISNHGEIQKQTLQCFIPKDSPENAPSLNEMIKQRFLVLYSDFNGNRKVLGTLDSGMRFKADLDTYMDPGSGRNGHLCTFYGESPLKAPFYIPL